MSAAGKRRHRIQIQRLSAVPNSFGEEVETWRTLATHWMAIRQLTGRELERAQEIEGQVTHFLEDRWPREVSVTPKMRCLFGSRAFNIIRVENVQERGKDMRLWVMEVIQEPSYVLQSNGGRILIAGGNGGAILLNGR